MPIKTITLWQPFATLIAIGAKTRETRSWAPRHIGPMAIHASVNRTCLDLIREEPFRSVLAAAGITSADQLPRGVVVAVARLGGTDPTEGIRDRITAQERAFGDYSDRRHAWLLEAVLPLVPPIAAQGAQGLWDWEPPAGLLEDYQRRTAGSPVQRRAPRPMADARDA